MHRLNLVIDPGAHLKVQLRGSVNESDSWVLMDYHPVRHLRRRHPIYQRTRSHFELDYGSGDNDLLTVTLVTLNPDAAEPTLSRSHHPMGGSSIIRDNWCLLKSETINRLRGAARPTC